MNLIHPYANVQDTYTTVKGRKDDIPFGNVKRNIYDSTEVDFNADEYLESLNLKSFPKWTFKTIDFKIFASKPIEVKINRQNRNYFAENESLDIYSIGSSEEEVIEDFCQQLIYFYKHYKELSWDKVIGQAKKLKELYEDIFQEMVI